MFKDRGIRLFHNLSTVARRLAEVNIDVGRQRNPSRADKRAVNTLPIIRETRKAGAMTLRSMVDTLNARGIHHRDRLDDRRARRI
jgi:hypothetical protein